MRNCEGMCGVNLKKSFFILFLFINVNIFSQDFKKVIIYGIDIDWNHHKGKDFTKKNIKRKAEYKVIVNLNNLANDWEALELYNSILDTSNKEKKPNNYDKYYRYLIVLKIKNRKNILVFIDKFGCYEIGRKSDFKYKLTKDDYKYLQKIFPNDYLEKFKTSSSPEK